MRTLSGVVNKITNIIPTNSADAPTSPTPADSSSRLCDDGSIDENWRDDDALEIHFTTDTRQVGPVKYTDSISVYGLLSYGISLVATFIIYN